jgi:hypothetical protein
VKRTKSYRYEKDVIIFFRLDFEINWCVGGLGRGVWRIFWHLPEQQHETLHEASEVVMPCD